jgi:hypothetical protein
VVDNWHYHPLEIAFLRTLMRSHTESGEAVFVAAKPSWWQHIEEIRSMLAEVQLPVIDRSVVERLFGLRRRQAIELMHRFGGYQAGRTFLIGREQLVEQLDRILAGDECRREAARRERVSAEIERVQRTRRSEAVRIPVTPDVFDTRMRALAPDVQLRPGKLEIEFAGAEDLLRKLFGLAQAVANDYGNFERAAVGGSGGEGLPA